MTEKTCATCTHYTPTEHGRSVCRLMPPVPTWNGHKIVSAWSMPKPDDYCAEHEGEEDE